MFDPNTLGRRSLPNGECLIIRGAMLHTTYRAKCSNGLTKNPVKKLLSGRKLGTPGRALTPGFDFVTLKYRRVE
jgi:hypothetical protein